ncbi:MAG TPA: M13 family metallopeptidase N-terminal domain-containing protein, partial [Myxococcales bacterium]
MTRAILVALVLAAGPTPPAGPAPQKHPLQELPYTPSLDLAAMDRSADPCADFYQYSCGGWMKANPIPPDQASWSVYGKLADENQQLLWGILEDAARPAPGRTPAQQKIGDFFASCMDEPALEKLGAAPLFAELKAVESLRDKAGVVALLPALHLATSGKGLMFG